jgi:hypothetical protein
MMLRVNIEAYIDVVPLVVVTALTEQMMGANLVDVKLVEHRVRVLGTHIRYI